MLAILPGLAFHSPTLLERHEKHNIDAPVPQGRDAAKLISVKPVDFDVDPRTSSLNPDRDSRSGWVPIKCRILWSIDAFQNA